MKRGAWKYRFFPKLEAGWNTTHAKPLSPFIVGAWLKKWQTWELPVLWGRCEESDNFAKTFWWMYNNKPKVVKEKKPKQLTII